MGILQHFSTYRKLLIVFDSFTYYVSGNQLSLQAVEQRLLKQQPYN